MKSSGTKDLDVATVVAALRTHYVPKRFRCAPVAAEYDFSATFSRDPL